jgi:hypothetical protein
MPWPNRFFCSAHLRGAWLVQADAAGSHPARTAAPKDAHNERTRHRKGEKGLTGYTLLVDTSVPEDQEGATAKIEMSAETGELLGAMVAALEQAGLETLTKVAGIQVFQAHSKG